MTSSVTPESGEPIYTLDDSKLYIGDGTTTANNLTPVNQTFATTGLSDVSSISPTNENFLLYNSSTSVYEPNAFALATLPEVYSAPTTANQVLAYDGNSSNPSYGKLTPTLITVDFLSDVNIASIQDGNTLVYDSLSSEWINGPQKTLETIVSGGTLVNAANDTDAANAGVPVGSVYRNGSVLQVRVT